MATPVPERQAVRVVECTHLFAVLIEGAFDRQSDLDLLDMALEAGHLTGKQVVVEISRTKDISARLLNALLQHHQRAGSLPWLAGPLSTPARRRLEITGTSKHFPWFSTLQEAEARSRGQ
ncbi:hypothetical protein [Streptomyces sp. NPDC055189]